ncbi:MAG: hypothetical protein K2J39_05975, partial [Ruminococcus sp.]|nr:hypothetical protein [Ruminococcus sp.]
MNRKIKKFLATVSAVAMCATSVVSIGAGALGVSTDKKLGAETVSFSANIYGNDIKFHLWQKATDYFDDEDVKIYISDTMVNSDGKEYTYKLKSNPLVYYNTTTEEYINYFNILKLNKGSFKFANKEDLINFEEYLSDNNIAHTTYDFSISLDCEFDDEYFD